MKLSKNQLKKIIAEEIQSMLKEGFNWSADPYGTQIVQKFRKLETTEKFPYLHKGIEVLKKTKGKSFKKLGSPAQRVFELIIDQGKVLTDAEQSLWWNWIKGKLGSPSLDAYLAHTL